MVYFSSFIVHVFIEILSVYESSLRLTELGSSSLILSISEKFSLILTLIGNYIGKTNFNKKSVFCFFLREMEGKCLRQFCRADEDLSYSKGSRQLYVLLLRYSVCKNMFDGIEKKIVPNSVAQQFFVPNSVAPAIFCP